MDLIERIKEDRKKGTPGPWVGGDDPDGEICMGDETGAWICCVNYDGTTDAQASADARRIARLPELEDRILKDAEIKAAAEEQNEALAMVLYLYDELDLEKGEPASMTKAVFRARDALAAYRAAVEAGQ